VEHTGGGDAGVCIRAAVLQTAECAGAAVVLLLLLLQQEALLLLLMGGESQRGFREGEGGAGGVGVKGACALVLEG